MKNNIIRYTFLFLLLFTVELAFSQDSTIVGTWKLLNTGTAAKFPETVTFNLFNDSLVLIPNNNDTLNFTRIVKYDSSSVLLKNIYLDTRSKKYKTYSCSLSLNDDGDKLKAEYNSVNKTAIEYYFQAECCSNHKPNHCAENPKDLQKLKSNGCSVFYRPR
jgi:hypothetical protein